MIITDPSAIRIATTGNGALTVYFPPIYWSAIFALFVTACTLFAAFWNFKLKKLPLVLLGLIFGATAGYLLTVSSKATLSKTENTLAIEDHLFWFSNNATYPLSSIRRAIVNTDEGNSHLMSFILNSGQDISIGGGWMPRGGYYAAENAINDYLASSKP